MRTRGWAVVLGLVGLAAGCDGAAASAPLQVTLAGYRYDQMALTALTDGDVIDLTEPPQGGFVLFVGARVRNVNDPTVELLGRLYDASGATMLAQDRRVVVLARSSADAQVWTPDLRSYVNMSNIAVCPSGSPTDLFDQAATLELTVTEKASGRSGVARRQVTPSCRQTDASTLQLCQCVCAGGYTLDKCGPAR